jgi:hypothetical protein
VRTAFLLYLSFPRPASLNCIIATTDIGKKLPYLMHGAQLRNDRKEILLLLIVLHNWAVKCFPATYAPLCLDRRFERRVEMQMCHET